MTDRSALSPREHEQLAAIERQLRAEAPALDHALATGVFRGLPDPPRSWRSRSAWPVVALVALGCCLVALSTTGPSALPLVVGTFLMSLSFLGLWLPLSRPARAGRTSTGGGVPDTRTPG